MFPLCLEDKIFFSKLVKWIKTAFLSWQLFGKGSIIVKMNNDLLLTQMKYWCALGLLHLYLPLYSSICHKYE